MSVAGAALRGRGAENICRRQPANISAVGSRPITRQLAKEFGADDTVDYREAPFAQQLMATYGRQAFDCVIIAGGEPPCSTTP